MMVTLLQEFQPLDSNLDLKPTVSISQWYLMLWSCTLILHNSSTHMMVMFSSNINKMLHVWMKECLWFLENTHDSLGTVSNWRFSGSLKVHSPSRRWHNSHIHVSARHGDHHPLLGLWLSWKQITVYMTWSSKQSHFIFICSQHCWMLNTHLWSGGIGVSFSSLSLQRLNILKSSTQQFQTTDFSTHTETSLIMHRSQMNKCIDDLLRNTELTEIQHSVIPNDRFQYTYWNISNHAWKSDE